MSDGLFELTYDLGKMRTEEWKQYTLTIDSNRGLIRFATIDLSEEHKNNIQRFNQPPLASYSSPRTLNEF
jgi:hypothetical protein